MALKPPDGPIAIYLAAAMIAGGVGTAGYQMAVPARPDPYYGTQADSTHKAMRREWTLDLREAVADLRSDMPPIPTRARIVALEVAVGALMRERDLHWAPPTHAFSDTDGGGR